MNSKKIEAVEITVTTHTATWRRITELLREAEKMNRLESALLENYAATIEAACGLREREGVLTHVRLGGDRPDIFEHKPMVEAK
jgi:hypothetical protein